MSSQPIPSALHFGTQAFPTLTAAQITRIRPLGSVRHVKKGEILFEPGETTIPFFVLLSGAMEIVQPSFKGERTVATHGPGEFTGEMTMISGRGSLVRGRVTEAGDFLELGTENLRTLPDAFHFGQCCPFGQFLSSARFEYDSRPCSRKELFGMPDTPIQEPKPSHASMLLDSVKASFNRIVRLIPSKARVGLFTGSIVLISLAVYTSLTGSATLNLICRHALRSADISVSIDGKTIYSDHISGSPKKFYEILGKRSETFSKSLTVPSGNRIVEVHLSSATDGFDQTRQCDLNLSPGKEATLLVEAQQSGMALVNKGSATASARNLESAYSDSLRSVLVTLLGSGVSAAIGFFVQEFLRSKKTVQAAQLDQHS